MNALHSKATPEWYTPSIFVEAARKVMGGIDTDPASCALANETVKADVYYDAATDGLSREWFRSVFINPPGGLVREFWRKTLDEYVYGTVTEVVWIGYSLQQLQTLQTNGRGPVSVAQSICYPRKRIAFVDANGVPSKSPTHANYIAYLGPNPERFAIYFSEFGETR